MTINHFYKKSESSMKSEAHTHFSSLVNIQGKVIKRRWKNPDNPMLISRTRRFCKSLTSQDWFDFIILTFIAANCITLAVERPTIPPWSETELVLTIEIHKTIPQVDREAYPECLQHNLHLRVHCRDGHEGCGQWVCVGTQQLLL